MRLLRRGRRFARNRRGATAITFALCLIPILMMSGFAIDFTLHLNYKKKVQHALDMAGLAAARHLNQDMGADLDTIETLARSHFQSELGDADYISLNQVDVTRAGMRINLEVDGTMPTGIMHLAGVPTMSLFTESEAAFGVPTKAEVVLVLDTSFSMTETDSGTETRIEALKRASAAMVTTLIDPDSPVDIKMAVVPFSDRVNVGLDHKSETWITGTDPEETTVEICTTSQLWYRENCTLVRDLCDNDGVKTPCDIWRCNGKEPTADDMECEETTRVREWHGCVKPRSPNNHLTDANYNVEQIPGHLSPNEKQCASPLRPLTDNADDLIETIDDMEVRNQTYMPTGLIWGYRMLTPNTPFAAEKTVSTFASEGGMKSIILMSDGANTLRLGTTNGILARIEADEVGTPRGTQTNEDTAELCTRVKDAGVEIYVVAYDIDDAATTTLLNDCASSDSRFFEATSTEEMKRVFEAITKQLGRDVSISG